MSLALVYLARGVDGGLPSVKRFFDAYSTFPAGCVHELIVVCKGWSEVEGLDALRQLTQTHGAQLVELPDDGLDWGAYMRLAPQLKQEWICFLNTHSRPLIEGWLRLLADAATQRGEGIGAVGATASWESPAMIFPPPSAKKGVRALLFYPLRFVRNLVRYAAHVRKFSTFPNPHLRSNAFIVRRELFVSFIKNQRIPRCKRDALLFESGRAGFSAYLINQGLKILVVGADGKTYQPKEWISSQTFRVRNQINLIVSDNQTTVYDEADSPTKIVLEKLAWGRIVS